MTIKICASMNATTLRSLERMMRKAERDEADLIEVRMDYLREKGTTKVIRKLSDLPLIATNRPLREGGLFEGADEERIYQLFSAVDSDFDFIDIELSTKGSREVVKRLKDSGAQTIISSHVFDSTPNLSTLNLIFNKELKTRADVYKIVMSAKTFEDNLRCLRFVEKASKKAMVTCFCMDEVGITSRLLSPLFGGCFTYASVEKGKEAAPGQLTVAEMRRFYEILGV
jgi:3-dehydroquinate dehydratase type I